MIVTVTLNSTFFPPPKIRALSPVGSGGAFSAGFIHGLSKTIKIKEAVKLALAAALANLSHTGPCFIEKKDIKKYLKKIRCFPY